MRQVKEISPQEIESLCAELSSEDRHGRFKSTQVYPQKFEKDDDTNFHVDFCTTSTNMRALTFGIELSDRLDVKLTAGKIIPAIQTTTAMIVGFVMMELFQLLQVRVHLCRYVSITASDIDSSMVPGQESSC